jgi:PleD family two-component response regulator
MNAHKGQLWVTSTGVLGEGCLFAMEIVVASVESPPEFVPPELEDSLVLTAQSFPFDLLHVLVVDDSPMNRKMLMLHLKGLGIVNITQACHGLEAVQAVEERLNVESDQKLFASSSWIALCL